MLVGPLAPPPSDPPPIVPLQQVDKRGYDHLFKYFRDEPVIFSSVTTARATLDAAHYYLCPELAKISLNYLTKNLTSSTVLEVYHGLSFYAHNDNEDENQSLPSAPPSTNDDLGEIGKKKEIIFLFLKDFKIYVENFFKYFIFFFQYFLFQFKK